MNNIACGFCIVLKETIAIFPGFGRIRITIKSTNTQPRRTTTSTDPTTKENMSLSEDISKIVTQTKTQATTALGWDVVMNYDEAELNNLLAAAHNEDSIGKRSIKNFECSLTTTTNDKTGENYTIDIQKFIATHLRPACSFVIPILGGTAKLGGDIKNPSESEFLRPSYQQSCKKDGYLIPDNQWSVNVSGLPVDTETKCD
ncbi:hypothetical protein Clacol_003356 [Clathrus columnatus]|uniref:Uncharacterized protein n=1 Tax=Clathrus columnatus TaxID=1419009 RepID=A0AAV5A392_9AGAM|nr:hypothetical protein Clacol_003356 [Clathrus columnatus]